MFHNEINERIKKHHNYNHLVKEFLRNKDIIGKCKMDILKICFKEILLCGKTWTEKWKSIKREHSKIQAMENEYFRAISGKNRQDKKY